MKKKEKDSIKKVADVLGKSLDLVVRAANIIDPDGSDVDYGDLTCAAADLAQDARNFLDAEGITWKDES